MIGERAHKSIDRAILVAAALWVLACTAILAVNVIRDPLAKRREALDVRIAQIGFVDESFQHSNDPAYLALRQRIMKKQALWNDLVAPPPPAPRVERGPNLQELIQGIQPSKREQLGTAQGAIKIKFRTEIDKVGQWKGVGDKVNDLTIKQITADEVLFETKIGGKDYEISVKRS